MKLYDKDRNIIIVTAISRPKFSDYGGRHWEFDWKKIDNKKIKFYYEAARGCNYYFFFKNKWYTMPYYPFNPWKKGGYYHTEDIKEFFTKKK